MWVHFILARVSFLILDVAFLQNNDDAKVILVNAVQHISQSVKIWMAAADLEHGCQG